MARHVWIVLRNIRSGKVSKTVNRSLPAEGFSITNETWKLLFKQPPKWLSRKGISYNVVLNKNTNEYEYVIGLIYRKKSQMVAILEYNSDDTPKQPLVDIKRADKLVLDILKTKKQFRYKSTITKLAISTGVITGTSAIAFGALEIAGRTMMDKSQTNLNRNCLKKLITLTENLRGLGIDNWVMRQTSELVNIDMVLLWISLVLKENPDRITKLMMKCTDHTTMNIDTLTNTQKTCIVQQIIGLIPVARCVSDEYIIEEKIRSRRETVSQALACKKLNNGYRDCDYRALIHHTCFGFRNELLTYLALYDTDIVPKVYESFICFGKANKYYIIMQSLNGTLWDILHKLTTTSNSKRKEFPSEISAHMIKFQLLYICAVLSLNNINHNLINPWTVMYTTLEDGRPKLYITNFSSSTRNFSEPKPHYRNPTKMHNRYDDHVSLHRIIHLLYQLKTVGIPIKIWNNISTSYDSYVSYTDKLRSLSDSSPTTREFLLSSDKYNTILPKRQYVKPTKLFNQFLGLTDQRPSRYVNLHNMQWY